MLIMWKARRIAGIGLRIGLLWVSAILFVASSYAQNIPFGGPTSGSAGQSDQGEVLDEPDTVGIFKYFALNPDQEFDFLDSILGPRVQQFDPAREREVDYATLGTLGSAARPIWFTLPFRQGFHVGSYQFDIYSIPFDSIPYFRVGRAYTDVGYVQGGQQADGYIEGRLGKGFGKNLSLNADYKRISQLGDRNQFPNQNSRNTALGVGVFFQSKGKRYRGFLGFSTNIIEQENNGGLEVEPTSTDEFSTPQSAEVFLSNAQSRYVTRTFGYTHHFSLTSPKQTKRGIQLTHQIAFSNDNYKTFHEFPNGDLQDSLFYQIFPDFLVDTRGGRFRLTHNRLDNRFYISFAGLDPGGPFTPRRQKGGIKVGVRHVLHTLDQSPVDSTLNNLFLEGEASFAPSSKIRIRAFGHLGLLDNGGDYRIGGDFDFAIGPFIGLYARFENQLFTPDWIKQRFILTETDVWNRDLRKTLATSVTGGIRFPKLNLRIEAGYHLLNNYVYFDSAALSQQSSAPISVFQLGLHANFKFWNFHLDNSLVGQQSTESDIIRLPELFGKHSLYYRGLWFRVLNVKIGFDGRYATTFFPDYYMPLTGQFVIQNGRPAEFYPSIDGFFALRITKFKAFVKWENMERLFSSFQDRFFYLTGFYPVPTGTGFRIGLRWRFEN